MTYTAFYQDDTSKAIFRKRPNNGRLQDLLPSGTVPFNSSASTYFRNDGGDRYEFAMFKEPGGRIIMVIADGVVQTGPSNFPTRPAAEWN